MFLHPDGIKWYIGDSHIDEVCVIGRARLLLSEIIRTANDIDDDTPQSHVSALKDLLGKLKSFEAEWGELTKHVQSIVLHLLSERSLMHQVINHVISNQKQVSSTNPGVAINERLYLLEVADMVSTSREVEALTRQIINVSLSERQAFDRTEGAHHALRFASTYLEKLEDLYVLLEKLKLKSVMLGRLVKKNTITFSVPEKLVGEERKLYLDFINNVEAWFES